jgi:hypothetical protein
VAVIFAVLAGGYLFGFLGVLLALPAASVILVLLRYLSERYRRSALYTDTGPTDPAIVDVEVDVETEQVAVRRPAEPDDETPPSP